ncbi:MAG: family 20 glycosylhydrolase [Planctomycetota bacterium]|nr:family 20 glycosylhydrolase [Planctomycetota bacterium]
MTTQRPNLAAGVLCLALAVLFCVNAANAGDLKFLPTPKSVKVTGGEMPLTAQTRVVATDPKLKPLAEIFANELLTMTQIRMAVAEGEGKSGDIVLKINPQLRADNEILAVQNREVKKVRDYAHTIDVGDMCVVEGWDYRAVCEGTATLLQALRLADGKASLPKMAVKDWPFADYTGYMLDCARQDVPLHALKSAVIAMRYWKVRYLHLHLADESTLMFPLRKWPEANKYNAAINDGDKPKVWDRQELIKLVAFADARGVTLVPEFETPGHCGGYQCAMLPALGDHNLRMMDVANDSIYPNLEEVINDMCEVFKSTPYFHIGGDEIELDRLKGAPHVKEYLKAHIKKNGKKTIYWGGYQGPPQDPDMKDCIVYSWYVGARQAQDNGLTTITVPWEIHGPYEKWNIFSSNSDMLKRTDSVLGGSRVAWEQSAEAYVNGCIYEAMRQEGTWAVDTVTADLKELAAREKALAEHLAKLLRPVTFKVEGKVEKDSYTDPLTVTMPGPVPVGCSIHYTMDGAEPAAQSPRYAGPFKVTGTLRPRAAIFDDASGLAISGYVFGPKFAYRGFEQSLSTGKPVEASGGKNPKEAPEMALQRRPHPRLPLLGRRPLLPVHRRSLHRRNHLEAGCRPEQERHPRHRARLPPQVRRRSRPLRPREHAQKQRQPRRPPRRGPRLRSRQITPRPRPTTSYNLTRHGPNGVPAQTPDPPGLPPGGFVWKLVCCPQWPEVKRSVGLLHGVLLGIQTLASDA